MTYKPEAIDTSSVKLPKGLLKLTEALARNNHDLWAKQRFSEGWTYGSNRDDDNKTHPDLIPYADLPDSEKEYERITFIEGLKAIMALGYEIVPPSGAFPRNKGYPHRTSKEIKDRLDSLDKSDLQELLGMWRILGTEPYAGAPKEYALLGNRILKAGEPLLAYDVITDGLKHRPRDLRLRQLQGLALARSGATRSANRVLTALYADGKVDGETLGILARTHKDLSVLARTERKKQIELKKAHDLYLKGYKIAVSSQKKGWRDDALYNGINAATTALLRNKMSSAKKLAGEVHAICAENLKKKKNDYWTCATLGEAALILGHFEEAKERYARAGELGEGEYGHLSSTRGQARALLKTLGKDQTLFDSCFRIPKVVVFSGHMLDQPGRKRPRFPLSSEKKAAGEIAAVLKRLDARIGFASAACGADILFLEEMLRLGGEINVILPFEKEAFAETSVDIIPGGDWQRRFNRVLKQAKTVITASEHRFSGNPVAYQYANSLQHGMAILRARMLDTDVIPMVLWDGKPGDGPWGTASFADYITSKGLGLEVIDATGFIDGRDTALKEQDRGPGVLKGGNEKNRRAEPRQEIKAMLFADVVGYGRIRDEQVPVFVDRFMGLVADLIDSHIRKPLTQNTWGDALYFVFDSPRDAGTFALELRDRVRKTDWEKKGLPDDLDLRISLHAGPLYRCKDPVINKYKYTGAHVSRAARIEPITPPGEVYASEAFAALAAAQETEAFALDYVGRVPLPKKSGIVPLYVLQRQIE
jgi:class 3 adenylate cyclase